MSKPRVDVKGAGTLRHKLVRLAREVLATEGTDAAEVCISIVDDDTMTNLNRRYTGRNGVTDVLAFSLREGRGSEHCHGHLGDVVVCEAQAQRQADELGIDAREEIARLVVHGILHLLGYQDVKDKERRRMQTVQDAYVEGRWDD